MSAKIINVDFQKRQVENTFTYKKSKQQIQLDNLNVELNKLKAHVFFMDTPKEFDKYVNRACNSIVSAYVKLLNM